MTHHARLRRHQRARRTARRHYDRQAALQSLSDRHAVALVVRSEREQVGLLPQRFQRVADHLAGEAHALANVELFGQRLQRMGVHRITCAAGDSEMPGEVEQPCQRAHQHVVPLARHQRRDRQDLATRTARARCARCIVGAGHDHGNAGAIDAELRHQLRRRRIAGDDDVRKLGEQALFDPAEPRGLLLLQSGLG